VKRYSLKGVAIGLFTWLALACVPVLAAQPTVVSYGNSTFSDVGNTTNTVAGVSWQAADIVVVFGGVANNTSANTLATPTITGGTGTGLTFTLSTSVNNDAANNDTQVYLWSATAAGTGSGTISSTTTDSSGGRNGIAAFVFRGSDGLGTPVVLDGSASKTITVVRGFANSHVVEMLADWNQVGDVAVDATPTGTVRFAEAESGQADFFVLSWGDQGGTGSTAYGMTNHTGTVDLSGIAIEVRGTAGGAVSPVRKILQQN
jgi:hypothetical protein